MLAIEEFHSSFVAVFIDHSYLHHPAARCLSYYDLQYHMYGLLEEVQLEDVTAFAYGNSLSIGVKTKEDEEGEHSSVFVKAGRADSKGEDCFQIQSSVIQPIYN